MRSSEQLSLILSVLPLRERLVVRLADVCGMGPGEIVGLQWSDHSTDGLLITRALYRGTIQTPKTHHSVRTVALPQSVRDDLEARRTITDGMSIEACVFPSEYRNSPKWANALLQFGIKPALKPLHLDWVNYQVLRRTAVTLLNQLGADATIVAAQLGHTVNVSTNIYNKIGIQRQAAAVQVLDTAIATRVSPIAIV